ncbi:hypothetical protein IWX90DRAFT_35504 [Phyllosticta citrichinensis]|uniref:Uncharacterized protein n=1 Tax=Phyllosticta citrichinensis TaxID=1130410 RepID=A0ABR1Y7N6_9PEZI
MPFSLVSQRAPRRRRDGGGLASHVCVCVSSDGSWIKMPSGLPLRHPFHHHRQTRCRRRPHWDRAGIGTLFCCPSASFRTICLRQPPPESHVARDPNAPCKRACQHKELAKQSSIAHIYSCCASLSPEAVDLGTRPSWLRATDRPEVHRPGLHRTIRHPSSTSWPRHHTPSCQHSTRPLQHVLCSGIQARHYFCKRRW